MSRARLALAISTLVALWGCTTPPSTEPPPSRERTTESDQTDADRRARVRMELASGYYSRGQYETALDEVKLALAVKPELPDAYNLRGLDLPEPGRRQAGRRQLQARAAAQSA